MKTAPLKHPLYELLPKEDWILSRQGDEHISAGIYLQPPNFIHKVLVKLSDLPNDLITNDDLVRFGIKWSTA